MPAATARLTACSTGLPTPSPPSEMLTTRAPFSRAISIARAMSRSLCWQPSSSVQSLGFDVLSERIRDSKAMPIAPLPSRFIAMTPLTAVPWPSVSVTPRLAATSWLAG